MTVVVELARVLTPENREEVLPRFFGLSRQESMEIVAELSPRPAPPLRQVTTAVRASGTEAPAMVVPRAPDLFAGGTTAPVETPTAAFPVDAPGGRPADLADANFGTESRGSSSQPSRQRTAVEPITGELRRLHITVSRGLLDKLDEARAALSHSMPGASDDEILEAGLDLLLAARAKRKGVVARPRKDPRPSTSGEIPAHVKRTVWERDSECCQWPTADGGICGSTSRVEFGHRTPKARGGPPTVENVRLLCAFHNRYEARLDFGDEHQEKYTRHRRASRRDRGRGRTSRQR